MRCLESRIEGANQTSPTVVLQSFGKSLGLAEILAHLPAFAELSEHGPQFEDDIKRLLLRGPSLRQSLDDAQRLLQQSAGVSGRRARSALSCGQAEVVHRLFGQFA